jgi:hypothetical protein
VVEFQTFGCFLTGVFLMEGFYRTMWLEEIYGLQFSISLQQQCSVSKLACLQEA